MKNLLFMLFSVCITPPAFTSTPEEWDPSPPASPLTPSVSQLEEQSPAEIADTWFHHGMAALENENQETLNVALIQNALQHALSFPQLNQTSRATAHYYLAIMDTEDNLEQQKKHFFKAYNSPFLPDLLKGEAQDLLETFCENG